MHNYKDHRENEPLFFVLLSNIASYQLDQATAVKPADSKTSIIKRGRKGDDIFNEFLEEHHVLVILYIQQSKNHRMVWVGMAL